MKFGEGRGKRLKLSFRQFIGLERDRQLRVSGSPSPPHVLLAMACSWLVPHAPVSRFCRTWSLRSRRKCWRCAMPCRVLK